MFNVTEIYKLKWISIIIVINLLKRFSSCTLWWAMCLISIVLGTIPSEFSAYFYVNEMRSE